MGNGMFSIVKPYGEVLADVNEAYREVSPNVNEFPFAAFRRELPHLDFNVLSNTDDSHLECLADVNDTHPAVEFNLLGSAIVIEHKHATRFVDVSLWTAPKHQGENDYHQ